VHILLRRRWKGPLLRIRLRDLASKVDLVLQVRLRRCQRGRVLADRRVEEWEAVCKDRRQVSADQVLKASVRLGSLLKDFLLEAHLVACQVSQVEADRLDLVSHKRSSLEICRETDRVQLDLRLLASRDLLSEDHVSICIFPTTKSCG